jgi:membrane associated rhomboid family serine protease
LPVLVSSGSSRLTLCPISVEPMAGQFSIVWPKRRGPSDPWFRVGSVDVTTTTFLCAICVLSFFVYAVDKSVLIWLAFVPDSVSGGQVWRVITWPLVNPPGIMVALSIFLMWRFGNDLEGQFGRVRFLRFLIACTVVPALFTTLAQYLITGGGSVLGIQTLGFAVFVAFVAEHPRAQFFFGIPAWILAVVIVGVNALQYLGDRLFLSLFFDFVLLAVTLILLRAFGFGHDVQWVPLVRLPDFMTSDGTGKKAKAKPVKAARSKSASSKGRSEPIVGPWAGSGSGPAATATQHDVDRILDKIAASGMSSLTPAEKATLEAASRARRDKNS